MNPRQVIELLWIVLNLSGAAATAAVIYFERRKAELAFQRSPTRLTRVVVYQTMPLLLATLILQSALTVWGFALLLFGENDASLSRGFVFGAVIAIGVSLLFDVAVFYYLSGQVELQRAAVNQIATAPPITVEVDSTAIRSDPSEVE